MVAASNSPTLSSNDISKFLSDDPKTNSSMMKLEITIVDVIDDVPKFSRFKMRTAVERRANVGYEVYEVNVIT